MTTTDWGGAGTRFEVVYVSSASSQEEFMASFREMPWLAVPLGHAQRRRRLREFFEAQDSDVLVLLSEMGEVIT